MLRPPMQHERRPVDSVSIFLSAGRPGQARKRSCTEATSSATGCSAALQVVALASCEGRFFALRWIAVGGSSAPMFGSTCCACLARQDQCDMLSSRDLIGTVRHSLASGCAAPAQQASSRGCSSSEICALNLRARTEGVGAPRGDHGAQACSIRAQTACTAQRTCCGRATAPFMAAAYTLRSSIGMVAHRCAT
jgi:hypothetical protein